MNKTLVDFRRNFLVKFKVNYCTSYFIEKKYLCLHILHTYIPFFSLFGLYSIFQAQFIAQSIGQAFQVAYVEFLKANGIEDHSFVKEMDYQEVLNSQEIFGNELAMFARKELQKEASVPHSFNPAFATLNVNLNCKVVSFFET